VALAVEAAAPMIDGGPKRLVFEPSIAHHWKRPVDIGVLAFSSAAKVPMRFRL